MMDQPEDETFDVPVRDDTAQEPVVVTPKRSVLRSLGVAAALLALFVLVFGGLVYAMQNRIMYRRTAFIPAPQGWTMETLQVAGVGGLHAWMKQPKDGKPVVLFFHGNADNMLGMLASTAGYAARGYGVLMPEYPGYAGNPGSPSEQSIKAEADAAMTWLTAHGVPANRIVIEGQSIGSGPAIHAAAKPHLSLVIISGIADMREVAKEHVGPFAFLVNDTWRNADAIKLVAGHKIVAHGMADSVVPYDQGVELAAAAKVPVISLPGNHGIGYQQGLQASIAQSVERRAEQGR